MKTLKLILGLLLIIGLQSCSSDDDNPEPVNEEEVITTMTIRFTPQGGGAELVLRTQDLDGDGPNDPVVTDNIAFEPNTVYNAEVEFLNELESPPEDITEEVLAEDEEHQVFYTIISSGDVTATYNDMDSNGNPVGVSFTLTTGSTSSNSMTVTLRHEPNKDASGVSDGDITNAGGETDIEATFSFSVN